MEAVLQIVNEISVVVLVGALVWIIRLEGAVKVNTLDIKRLRAVEGQAHDQEIRIKQRDEEMRGVKFSLDELKARVAKVESNQASTSEALVRIETKLDILMKGQGMD